MDVELRIDEAALNFATRSPDSELGRWLRGELVAVEFGAKQRCPVDEGELRASSTVEVRPTPTGLEGELQFQAAHALFVHEGTRPHWPPVGALTDWARRHGIPNPFLVARAIALRGTRAVPFLRDAARARFPEVG